MAIMQKVNVSNRSGYESLVRVYRESDLSQEKTRILSNEEYFFLLFNDIEHINKLV